MNDIASSVLLVMACLLLVGCSGEYSGEQPPALAIVNAQLLTMDPQFPQATAMLVEEGRISVVGSDAEIRQQASADTRVIDLQGRTVTPGFNDAHMHAMLVSPAAVAVGPPLNEKQALIDRLRSQVEITPPGHWIIGYGYDDKILGAHLNREDLDLVSRQHPVLVFHTSFHLGAVNSLALDTSTINKNTADPEDGFFYRDEDGEPTGLLGEKSAVEMLVDSRGRPPLVDDLASAREQLNGVYRKLHSLGITSISDAMVTPALLGVYWLSDPEQQGVRVNLMLEEDQMRFARWLQRFDSLAGAFGRHPFDNEWLRVKTVKVFHGMSLSGRTARLYEPYHDRPDYHGEDPQRTQQELDALVKAIHDTGLQAAIHSNGDYEIDMALTAIERAQAGDQDNSGPRHRIEHGTLVNNKILARMRELGIVLAPHSYISEKGHMLESYGAARWCQMLPNASTFEYGIPNAGNSDFPVSRLNPMLRMQSLVLRQGLDGKTYCPEQRLTVMQALQVYTLGGAYASFEETQKGSLTPGKWADFLVLSGNPMEVAPEQLHELFVEKTFVGGVEVFSLH